MIQKKIDFSESEIIDIHADLNKINKNLGVVTLLFFDSAQSLWICTDVGLFVKYKNSNVIKECNTTISGNPEATTIYSCIEDIEGRIWLGTKNTGLHIYHPDIDSTIHLNTNSLIDHSDIYSLIMDKNNDLWFSSNQGIFRYTSEHNTIDHFTEIDGISGQQFNPNAAFLCSNGNLLFGATNGFNVINPSIIKKNTTHPDVFLSKFHINNQAFSKGNTVECNSFNLGSLKEITLNYEPTLNIQVVSNNYIKSEKNRIKYRLVNYENKWLEIPYQKEIVYTKLPPGRYVFEAFGSNNDNLWSKKPYRLEITVRQPLLTRWYSILLYLIIISGTTLIIINNTKAKLKLKKEIISERYKNKAIQQISEERVKIFMKISNEIRTPLTLITSPIQLLLSKFNYDQKTKELLMVVDRNAQRLIKLTNQSLDYGLLEEDKLKPNFDKTDIIQITSNTYQYFEHQISEKQLNFSFTSKFKNIRIITDANLVEKIIFNLLSNAVKYTGENGTIKVSIDQSNLTKESYKDITYTGNKFIGKCIKIQISDTGKGMGTLPINTIFNNQSSATNKHQPGAGLGLHLCQEYAKISGGNIMVSSKEHVGSTFTLNLPMLHENDFEQTKTKDKNLITHIASNNNENPTYISDNSLSDPEIKRTILIVENNNEYRSYLKTYLSKFYKVITAKNAEQAIDILETLQPEIILTELVFQGMTGLQFIEKIKVIDSLKNVPIIVLTSHTESKYHIESVQKGVNSYYTKPIDNRLLLAKIRNLFAKQSEQKTTNTATSKNTSINGLSFESESFIAISERIIEENFQNINFDSSELSEKLKISKSTLFRKIKKHTSLSTTEFIREVRLKKALDLLNSNTLTNDEIATYVGFNSTSYFIRSFKKRFGKTPREYINQKPKKTS